MPKSAFLGPGRHPRVMWEICSIRKTFVYGGLARWSWIADVTNVYARSGCGILHGGSDLASLVSIFTGYLADAILRLTSSLVSAWSKVADLLDCLNHSFYVLYIAVTGASLHITLSVSLVREHLHSRMR